MSQPGVVLTEKRALLILESHLAVAPRVYFYTLSPSGRYLVAVQEEPSTRPLEIGGPPPEPVAKRLVVWDSQTGVGKEIPLPKEIRIERTTVDWIGKSEKALVLAHSDRMVAANAPSVDPSSAELTGGKEWHILDVASATMRKVGDEGKLAYTQTRISVSPVAPYAMRVYEEYPHFEKGSGQRIAGRVTVQRLDADGKWSTETKLPAQYETIGNVDWSADGRTFQLEARRLSADGQAVENRVLLVDPMTGALEDVIGPVPTYTPAQDASDVSVVREVTEAPSTTSPSFQTWWLRSTTKSESEQALVAANGYGAQLPPGERYVAYVVEGALFTRQIVELSLDQYRQMKESASKAVAISDAKQVALAALMYAADYDDVLPANLGGELLEPYLKNGSIFDGFVFVFGGGDLKKVADPANTVLGYKDGPGGRAVAYLDGHVVWEKTGG
jgi:hypothetical protein